MSSEENKILVLSGDQVIGRITNFTLQEHSHLREIYELPEGATGIVLPGVKTSGTYVVGGKSSGEIPIVDFWVDELRLDELVHYSNPYYKEFNLRQQNELVQREIDRRARDWPFWSSEWGLNPISTHSFHHRTPQEKGFNWALEFVLNREMG